MPKLLAVIRSRGSGWAEAGPLEQQVDWRLHADFMNGLHAAGFVLLGGPLEGTADVLLIVRAESEDAIAARLAEDCWSRDGLLRISRTAPWQLRLGALG